MGDLVFGLAKTVVEGTLLKAKSAIDEEEELQQSVQRDLVFITGEFQMMQCFLGITDEERAKNVVVRTWVRQLRDLAYDVEDCIEFVVHLDNKSAWWCRVLPSCMAPALPLDEAVDNIKELKERVLDMSNRYRRYNLMGDSGSKPAVAQQHPAIAGATEFDMLVEAKIAAKKQLGLWDLTELIYREDSDLQVISLWGTSSDLGMKSIIRKAYVDPEICQTFSCRAWVKLVHPFNPREFIHSLLAQFYAYSCQEQQAVIGVDVLKRMKAEAATEEDLMDEFVKQMSKQRYLVVLEDLSTMVEWDACRMYLPDMKNGSRIVVSTQQFEIANLCTGHPCHISEIRQLSADHSVCVFFKEGSQHAGNNCKDDVSCGVSLRPRDNFHPFESEAAHILNILKRVDIEIRRNNKSLAFHVMSVLGIAGVGKSSLVGSIYRGQMESKYSHRWGKYAWVDVSHPFNLEEFSQRLLWELCSITTKDEEVQIEYFGENLCRDILREHRCLVVIDGLQSIEDWDVMNTAFEFGAAKGCTIVITNESSLAQHCAHKSSLVCKVKSSEHDPVLHLFIDQGSQHDRDKFEDEVSHRVTPQDDLHLVGRQSKVADILFDWGISTDLEIGTPTFSGNRITSVWGIAGVGKSTLVRSIYRDQMKFKCSHRWSKHGWVDVPHPFNLREFSRSLLTDLSSKSTDGKANEYFGILSVEDPVKECRDILRAHRCLIVIDDLQSIEDWDSINTALQLRSTKSCTIVVTNEASLAIHCADKNDNVYNIRSLESDEALQLFKDQLPELNANLGPGIMEQVEVTVFKCGGIPKVILAVCHFLATIRSLIQQSVVTWQYLNRHFIPSLMNQVDFDDLRGLFGWMDSYFRSCPDSLKPYVFYLPIFPPNHNIRRRRLVRRWIAEGYSRHSVDATAEKSFDKLINLSMIQPSPQAIKSAHMSLVLCQVNGFFREYIISQPMEDNMVFALEERCSQSSQYTGRHLVIKSSWDRDSYVFERIDFSRLRSLTVFGGWRSFFISDKMKVLRVLDLEDTSGVTNDDLEQITKLLSCLKFLSLRRCRGVSRLPISLRNLKQLETLDCRHTRITMLPQTIIKLQKLQYIRAGTEVSAGEEPSTQPRSEGSWLPKFCRRQFISPHLDVKVPRGIGKLRALDTIGVVNVGVAEGNAILEELKNLTQVHKLGVSGIHRENIDDFYSTIFALAHLESLSVRLEKDEQSFCCSVENISEPLKENLKSLKLYGLVDKLPSWIKQFKELRKLTLGITIVTQEMMHFVSDMTGLRSLRLCVKPIQDGEQNFHFSYYRGANFLWLEVLQIDCSSRFILTFQQGAMTFLELLKVYCSSGSQISGLVYLENLKKVWIIGSYDDALKQNLEGQLAEHPNKNKPVLKLEEVSSC